MLPIWTFESYTVDNPDFAFWKDSIVQDYISHWKKIVSDLRKMLLPRDFTGSKSELNGKGWQACLRNVIVILATARLLRNGRCRFLSISANIPEESDQLFGCEAQFTSPDHNYLFMLDTDLLLIFLQVFFLLSSVLYFTTVGRKQILKDFETSMLSTKAF